jgi:uncharacterized protein YodC (DUF2158 family)
MRPSFSFSVRFPFFVYILLRRRRFAYALLLFSPFTGSNPYTSTSFAGDVVKLTSFGPRFTVVPDSWGGQVSSRFTNGQRLIVDSYPSKEALI